MNYFNPGLSRKGVGKLCLDEQIENIINRSNSEYYSQLYSNHPHGIIIIRNSKIIDCNSSAIALFGFSRKDNLIGNHPFTLSPEYKENGSCTIKKEESFFRRVLKESSMRFNCTLKKKNGNVFFAEVILIANEIDTEKIVISIIRSISAEDSMLNLQNVNSENIKLKKEFEFHKSYFAQLFNNSPHGILIIDNDCRIREINSSFKKMFLYQHEEIVNKKPIELLCTQVFQEEEQSFVEDIEEENYTNGLRTIRKRKDGSLLHVAVYTFPIITNGEVKGKCITYLDVTRERDNESIIKFLTYRDNLTKLYNRDFFFMEFNKFLDNGCTKKNNTKMALLLLDINEFKSVNDNLGYFVGDSVLKTFADRLKSCVQKRDLIARFGGDEFVILIPEIEKEKTLLDFGREVLDLFNNPFVINNSTLYLSASIGISIFPDHGQTPLILIQNAEIAMYNAKKTKSNKLKVFDKELMKEARENFLLDNHLRYALDNKEFYLNYQPIIDTITEAIVGTEALVRWQSEEMGFVAPNKFIHIAEKNGMIIPLGEWVLRSACMQLKRWHNIGYKNMFMSINVSIKQLEQNDFASLIENILNEIKLKASCLVLEITETVYMENLKRIYNNLKQLNKLGVKLSIDDFGTGYSSLGQLKRLEISKLKIDKSFIQDINTDVNNTIIISAIIAMAKSLNLNIVAEGVEKPEHLVFLKEKGCDMLQGYLFSKPVPSYEIEKLLSNSQTTKY